MILKVTEASIERITAEQARELRNEINKATGGALAFKPDEYPQLTILYKLLTGAFDSSHNGVHFVSKRGE